MVKSFLWHSPICKLCPLQKQLGLCSVKLRRYLFYWSWVTDIVIIIKIWLIMQSKFFYYLYYIVFILHCILLVFFIWQCFFNEHIKWWMKLKSWPKTKNWIEQWEVCIVAPLVPTVLKKRENINTDGKMNSITLKGWNLKVLKYAGWGLRSAFLGQEGMTWVTVWLCRTVRMKHQLLDSGEQRRKSPLDGQSLLLNGCVRFCSAELST